MTLIRLAQATDSAGIAAIYAPFVEQTFVSFETAVPEQSEIGRRITEIGRTHPWLVCEHAGSIAAFAYASPHRTRGAYRWSADVSVYVDAGARRLGIARRLYETIFSLLDLQGYYRVHAGIALPNPASVAFHESLGFEPVGIYRSVGYKLGAWRDVGWWQRAIRISTSEPSDPFAISDARVEKEREAILARANRSLPA